MADKDSDSMPRTANPELAELESSIQELLQATGGTGKRASKRSAFSRFLAAHFDWFTQQHQEHGLTWEAWAELMERKQLRNISGAPYTARALKGAYQRMKDARKGKGTRRATPRPAAPPVAAPAPVAPPAVTKPAPPAPAAGLRTFLPAGGEKDWTKGT